MLASHFYSERPDLRDGPTLKFHEKYQKNTSPVLHFLVFLISFLASQKIALAIASVFKSQNSNRNFRRKFRKKIAKKSRNEIANRSVLKSQIQNRNVFCARERSLMMPNLLTCLWQKKSNFRCPNLQSKKIAAFFSSAVANRSVFAISKSQRFRDAKKFSLVFSLSGISLVFRGFSPSFPGFSWVRQEQKILGIFGVFLGFRQQTRQRRTGARAEILEPQENTPKIP